MSGFPPALHLQAVELGEGLLLDEFGRDFDRCAALGEDHGAKDRDSSGFTWLAVEGIPGRIRQPG